MRALHIDSLVETKYTIALQVSIDSVWCVLSAGICNVEVCRLGGFIFWRVGNVCDEDKAGRLDRFNESGSERLGSVREKLYGNLRDTHQ